MSEEEETELISRAASGDVEAKLQLVKEHLDLVVGLAAGYAMEMGKPFPQMVQVGTLAIIKAVEDFHPVQQTGFADHVKYEVTRALKELM